MAYEFVPNLRRRGTPTRVLAVLGLALVGGGCDSRDASPGRDAIAAADLTPGDGPRADGNPGDGQLPDGRLGDGTPADQSIHDGRVNDAKAPDVRASDAAVRDAAPHEAGVSPDGSLPPAQGELCEGSGWCWMSPTPPAWNYRLVWGLSGSEVLVVASGATDAQGQETHSFLRYGTTWSVAYERPGSYGDIWGAAGHIFVPDYASNAVLHYDGSTFSAAAAGTGPSRVFGFSPSEVYALCSTPGCANGTAAVHRFDGTSWLPMPDTRDWNLRGIWGTSGTNLWVSGGPSPSPQNPFVQPAGQFRRFDGQAWQLVTVPTSDLFQSIAGTSPTDIYADSGVRLWHYDGVSWTVRSSARPPGQRLWMLGSSTLLSAVPSTPSVFDGTGWTYLDAPMPCSFVWGTGTKDLLAAGGNVNRSGLYRYDGTRWTWLRSGITLEDFRDVWGASASSVYAAGTGGTLARFDGKTWRLIPSGTTATFDRVRGSGPSSVFAWGHAGPGSAAHVSFTDGSSARALPSPGGPINDLFARGPNEAYAVGDAGFLARFDGQVWTRIPNYYTYDFVSVAGLAPQKLVLLSRNGRIVTFDGTSWSDVNPYDRVSGFAGTRTPLTAVCSDGAATLAVVGDNGRILVFDGTTWSTRSLLPPPFGTGPKTCVTLGPNEIWWGPRRYPTDPAPMRTATQAPVRAMFPFSTELFAVGDVGTIVHRKLP